MSARKSEIKKKKTLMNVCTNIKKLYARNNISKKKNSKCEILNHLYFFPIWSKGLLRKCDGVQSKASAKSSVTN